MLPDKQTDRQTDRHTPVLLILGGLFSEPVSLSGGRPGSESDETPSPVHLAGIG